MNIAAQLLDHMGVVHVILGPFVYRLRRITSEDLRVAGYVELVGASASAEALRQVQQEMADERVKDPVKRERFRVHNEEIEQADRMKRLEGRLSTPEGRADWLRRMDAYVVASVTGMGRVRPGVEVPTNDQVGTYQVLPPDAPLQRFTDEVHPFRFVATRAAEQPNGDPPSVHVQRLTLLQRQALGFAAMAAQEVVSEILPLSGSQEG